MRARPDPRDRLAPLRRRRDAADARPQPAEPEPVPDATAGFGGWVPDLPSTPEPAAGDGADELVTRWAPPSPAGRHRAPKDADGREDVDEDVDEDVAEPGGWADLDAWAHPGTTDDEWAEVDDETADVDEAGTAAEPATADEPTDEPTAPRRYRIGGRWGRFAELWVPEPLRNARLDPGRRGMIVLVLVAAIAAVATAFGVWRDRPEPRPIETATVAAISDTDRSTGASAPGPSTATPLSAAAAAGASGSVPPAGEILVSVTGLVANPGVVRLAPDSRVADAIAAAGGTQPGANLTGLNLAAKLADGDSVVVTDTASAAAAPAGGSPAGAGGSGSGVATAPGGLVNLNTADEAALDTLPGVGPVMAQNILAWRQTNGRFTSVEQLQEISGIGPARYAQISALVTVG